MQSVKNLAILGAVAFAVPVQADDVKLLKPVTTPPMEVFLSTETGDARNRSDGCPATNLGILSSSGGTWSGDTTGLASNFENDYPAVSCSGYGSGGADEIFKFQVDSDGVWDFDTCTVAAGWDTSLGLRLDTGSGCPGDPVVCDGDSCHVGAYESALSASLTAGTDYYMVVDGWTSTSEGPFTVTYSQSVPACTSDADCSDGDPCNGAETCDLTSGGQCKPGTPPCERAQTCNLDGSCTDPESSLIYQNTGNFPGGWTSLGGGTEGTLIADDWGFAAGKLGRKLQEYNVTVFGAAANYGVVTAFWPHGDLCNGGNGDGLQQCDVDADCTGLLCTHGVNVGLACTVDADCPGSCSTAGTNCLVHSDCPEGEFCASVGSCPADGTCEPAPFDGRYPAHTGEIPGTRCVFTNLPAGYFLTLSCSPVPSITLPADGVWQVMGFFNTGGSAGPALAGQVPEIGTSNDVFLWDLGSKGTAWARFLFACNGCAHWMGDLRTEPVGACCTPDLGGICSIVTEAECTAGGGTLVGFNNAVHQFDCDVDADGDGTVNLCDACPDSADFATDSGPCNCSTSDVDGDGTLDCVDACPNNPDFAADRGPCQCNSSDMDNDECLDCVDACPDDPAKCSDDGTCGCGVDDNADTDADGVPDCIDQCNGVDDAVFAPECVGRIPTVSEWGLAILALLVLIVGKLYFGRQREDAIVRIEG